MRQSRKLDHINYATKLSDGPGESSFDDFTLLHNCLPEISSDEIDISSTILDLPLVHPIIINAITGGSSDVLDVNMRLAEIAAATNSVMAVGSQYAGLEDAQNVASYKIVRKKNPAGIIFSNLGAHVSPNDAIRAVEMLESQALQLHLNPAQEIIMKEGDRSFSGYLKNIESIVSSCPVPVIIKEVGCGMAAEQVQSLIDIGVMAIDVGGRGGTNFIAIEGARRQLALSTEMLSWGIPTMLSALEAVSVLPQNAALIVSGGVRSPLDVIKALAIGGAAVGIAAPFLRMVQQDIETTVSWFDEFLADCKRFMLLTGAKSVNELRGIPIVITGYSREWLTARGIDITAYATPKRRKASRDF